MNYEEKYKEGLAEAMKHYNSGCATEGEKRMLERLYSELKESEDEGIARELLEYAKDEIRTYNNMVSGDYDSRDKEDKKMHEWWKKVVAYLEKQKEQKPEKNIVCPSCLDEAIRLYYFTYGNGKGGFDYLSLSKFQDIVEEFVKEYGQKPAGAHSYLENSVDTSSSVTETDFAEEYAYGVFEELKKKFKENGNFAITCDEASNIALNAILDGIDWFKKQAKDEKECIGREEQKPVCGYAFPKFRVGDRIYDRRDSYNRNVIREVGKDYYINAFAQKMDMAYTDANFEFLEHLNDDITPNKPAEWGEEDERKYQCIRCILLTDMDKKVGSWKYSEILEWYEKRGIGRYTNSKPHWKPSEEQINALKVVARGYPSDDPEAIESLLNDLKKFTKNEK